MRRLIEDQGYRLPDGLLVVASEYTEAAPQRGQWPEGFVGVAPGTWGLYLYEDWQSNPRATYEALPDGRIIKHGDLPPDDWETLIGPPVPTGWTVDDLEPTEGRWEEPRRIVEERLRRETDRLAGWLLERFPELGGHYSSGEMAERSRQLVDIGWRAPQPERSTR